MRKLTFKNKDEMPAFGLGTWKSEPGEVYDAVRTAIEKGYRHIDCAPAYGNEKEIGKALSECIDEGIVARDEVWLTSKLWNTDHLKEDVLPALKRTLTDLQVDYLDLFLIHWPVALKPGVGFPQDSSDFLSPEEAPISATWQEMEKAVNAGLIRHIGVSNFGIKRLEELMANSVIKPEMNQIECHPYLHQTELIDFCHKNGIHVTAYSPLGSPDRPDQFKAANEPSLLKNPVIEALAKEKGCNAGQILMSWALHRGLSVIPKSVNPGRIAENLKAESVELSDDDMDRIHGLERGFRYVTGEFWVSEGGPYTMDNIWD
jgi:alcohol dehydrogenase (NADP+)